MPDTASGRVLTTGQEDVFGVQTTNVLKNVLDIGAHYPINPERLRIFVNGSRKFPQYNSVSEYNHAGPHHELIPSAGDTVTLQTAERPRYTVGFEQIFSKAFGLSRSLESGDRLRVGAFDDNDGWYLEHRGEQNDDQCDLVVREGGSDTTDAQDVVLEDSITTFNRHELRTAWYRVTRQLWRQSHVSSEQQQTSFTGLTNVSGGPEVANLPIRFEIKRDANSSSLTVKAGSIALLVQGDNRSRARAKTHPVSIDTTADAGTNTWLPLYAMRVDPGRDFINTQVSNIKIMEYSGSGDVRLMLKAHDASKVKDASGNDLVDSDFNTPKEHVSQNSVLEETTAVDQAADESGTLSTSTGYATDDKPGGYQIQYASLYSSGQGSNKTQSRGEIPRKRAIYGGDIAVLWVRADNTSETVIAEINTSQDW